MQPLRRFVLLSVLLLAVACGSDAARAPEDAPSPAATDAAAELDGEAGAADGPLAPENGAESGGESSGEAGGQAEDRGEAAVERVVSLHGPDGDTVTFAVEVVADQAGRQLGLMHRTALAEDAGMLFLFPDDRQGGFWMKDTLIPLSIAFIAADGDILAILDMEPCEADPCPSYNPGVTYRSALEVNQGAFEDAGVDTDWRVELPVDLPPVS
jgi:uncharacterized protein